MPPHPKKRANHLHGSQPVLNRNSRHGTPITRQHNTERHYVLATVGVYTYVTADGEYFNTPFFADKRTFEWAAKNKLIARDMTLGRNQRSWPVVLTDDGKRVLAVWNAKYGEIDIEKGL